MRTFLPRFDEPYQLTWVTTWLQDGGHFETGCPSSSSCNACRAAQRQANWRALRSRLHEEPFCCTLAVMLRLQATGRTEAAFAPAQRWPPGSISLALGWPPGSLPSAMRWPPGSSSQAQRWSLGSLPVLPPRATTSWRYRRLSPISVRPRWFFWLWWPFESPEISTTRTYPLLTSPPVTPPLHMKDWRKSKQGRGGWVLTQNGHKCTVRLEHPL